MKPLWFGRVVPPVSQSLITMKNSNKLFLPLVGLVLLGSSLLRADEPAGPPPPPPPGEHHERRDEMRENFKRMIKELNLTSDQQIQVEAIQKQTAEQLKTLHNDTSLSDDQRRAKGRELRKSTEDQIMAVLTPEQQVKAQEPREKREKQGHHGPADGPPPSGEAPPPPAPPAT